MYGMQTQPICMLRWQHTHTHTLTHSIHYSFPPSQSIRPLAHTEANTYYTHTVNLTPCSNAERIVPGLGDIKSLDYPIKSYSPPLPHLHKISGINHCTVLWGKGVVCACKCERTNTNNGLNDGAESMLSFCSFDPFLSLNRKKKQTVI